VLAVAMSNLKLAVTEARRLHLLLHRFLHRHLHLVLHLVTVINHIPPLAMTICRPSMHSPPLTMISWAGRVLAMPKAVAVVAVSVVSVAVLHRLHPTLVLEIQIRIQIVTERQLQLVA
jgi:hypothetical protein